MDREIEAYLRMPKVRLLALINLESNNRYKFMEEIYNDWVKNKKCECCQNPLLVEGKIVLNCHHLKKEWDTKLEKINKKINKKINALLLKNLASAYCTM